MTAGRRLATAISLVLAALLLGRLSWDVHAVRMILALACCLVLPGLGWSRRMRLRDAGDTLALAVVLSISASVVVATAMALAGQWSTVWGTVVLLAVAGLGFVPSRTLQRLSPVPARSPRRAAVAGLGAADPDWVDWYADARRRSAAARARADAEARAIETQWADWYAREGGGMCPEPVEGRWSVP